MIEYSLRCSNACTNLPVLYKNGITVAYQKFPDKNLQAENYQIDLDTFEHVETNRDCICMRISASIQEGPSELSTLFASPLPFVLLPIVEA
jgi:hypothetical protein